MGYGSNQLPTLPRPHRTAASDVRTLESSQLGESPRSPTHLLNRHTHTHRLLDFFILCLVLLVVGWHGDSSTIRAGSQRIRLLDVPTKTLKNQAVDEEGYGPGCCTCHLQDAPHHLQILRDSDCISTWPQSIIVDRIGHKLRSNMEGPRVSAVSGLLELLHLACIFSSHSARWPIVLRNIERTVPSTANQLEGQEPALNGSPNELI